MTSPTAQRIVAETLEWLGTPYRHQGGTKGVGCDCIGLVRGVWRTVYGTDPGDPGPYAADWAEQGGADRLIEAARRLCMLSATGEPQAGDLILFRWRPRLPAKHCGIALAADRFVHAYQGHAVTASALVPQWRRRVAGIFTFPDIAG